MKGIVFDRDGTLYSASKYVAPFAEHLSRHFDSREFMASYHEFRDRCIVGRRYNKTNLLEQEDGKWARSTFWIPGIIALHYGFEGNLTQEFNRFSDSILKDSTLQPDAVLQRILTDPSLKKALVSNAKENGLLGKLGIAGLFDIRYFEAKKDQNLDRICKEIGTAFSANYQDILWVEDDIGALEMLKRKGYRTALRKTRGFNYPPDEELRDVADIILADDLTDLREALGNAHKE